MVKYRSYRIHKFIHIGHVLCIVFVKYLLNNNLPSTVNVISYIQKHMFTIKHLLCNKEEEEKGSDVNQNL